MIDIRSAIHVRAGQRGTARRIDEWFGAHGIEVVDFDDVYETCVYLLRHYENIPDVAFIGVDWLNEDEFNIVPYIRQTWPRVGIVVYGNLSGVPLFDVLPLMITCGTPAAVDAVLRCTPDELASRLAVDVSSSHPISVPRPVSPGNYRRVDTLPRLREARPGGPDKRAEQVPASSETTPEKPPVGAESDGQSASESNDSDDAQSDARSSLKLEPGDPPRTILTPDELSALLDRSERD